MLTDDEIFDFFINEHENYYLKREDIKDILHKDLTINLLLILSKLTPTKDLIGNANDDCLFLNISLSDLTIYDLDYIKDLIRSGLCYDSDDELFYINV